MLIIIMCVVHLHAFIYGLCLYVCVCMCAHACICVCAHMRLLMRVCGVCGVTENNLDAKVDVRIAKASKAFGALRNSCYL